MKNLSILASGCLALVAIFFVTFSREARDRADFVWNNTSEPQTLDPQRMSGQTEGDLAAALFEGLTVYHPQSLEPLPGVARSWETDGLVYTFHLRDDSWWVQRRQIMRVANSPRRVTAGDFAASWRALTYPERGSDHAYLLYLIEGYEDYAAAVASQWTGLLARYSREHPERVIVGPSDLDPEDRESVARLRDERWRDTVRIRALDSDTLEVRLRAAAPYFTYLTSFYALSPVPAEVVAQYGDRWTLPENIATNGPYTLESWRFNAFIRLRKNPFYWETEASVSRRLGPIEEASAVPWVRGEREFLESFGSFERHGLEVLEAWAVEEQNTSLNLYINGDVDRVRELPSTVAGDLIAAASSRPGVPHLHHGPQLACYLYNLNMNLDVFSGPDAWKLRRAMSLAIDRDGLIATVTREEQIAAYGLVPPGVPGHPARRLFGSADRSQDLAEARRLIDEFRAAQTTPLPRLRILYNTNENHAKIAAFIQAGWKKELGLECDLMNQEWGVFLESRESGNFDVARMGWVGDYPDANTFLDLFTTGNPNNDCRYSDEFFDWLVSEVIPHLDSILFDEDERSLLVERLASQPLFAAGAHGDRPELFSRLVDRLPRTEGADRLEVLYAVRRVLLELAEEVIIADMPVIPIFFYVRAQLWPPELEGCTTNLLDYHPPKFFRWKNGRRPRGDRYAEFPRL